MNEVKIKEALALLESKGFMVLSKYDGQEEYAANEEGEEVGVCLVVDTETTGLDTKEDRIFEFGGVLFEYGFESGKVFRIIEKISQLEDPGVEIPESVIKITHVDPEEVKGKKFDEMAILSALERANFVVAHNSGFDRKMLEKRFPQFSACPWGCSLKDVKWSEDFDIGSGKLDYIAFKLGFHFDGAHRASNDCAATVHVLAQEREGRSIFSRLLESARQPSFRVWATGSPFETKDLLKKNGYSWNGGEDGRPKAWYKDVRNEDLETEKDFLAKEVYASARSPEIEKMDAFNRYSVRRGEMLETRRSPGSKFGMR